MGREIRKVPANWQHPKDAAGKYIPLLDGYDELNTEWENAMNDWMNGIRPKDGDSVRPFSIESFVEHVGPYPDREDYVDYKGQPATHYALYETVTEGTPLTSAFASLEALEDHLVKVGTFNHEKMFRDQAHLICTADYIPTFSLGETEPLDNAKAFLDKIREADNRPPGQRL